MPGEIFEQQQKQQQPIQITKEEEQLNVNREKFAPDKQLEQQQTAQQERQMTQATEQILKRDNVASQDDTDAADPPMEFADEQQREWYNRKRAALVEHQVGDER